MLGRNRRTGRIVHRGRARPLSISVRPKRARFDYPTRAVDAGTPPCGRRPTTGDASRAESTSVHQPRGRAATCRHRLVEAAIAHAGQVAELEPSGRVARRGLRTVSMFSRAVFLTQAKPFMLSGSHIHPVVGCPPAHLACRRSLPCVLIQDEMRTDNGQNEPQAIEQPRAESGSAGPAQQHNQTATS